MSDPSSASVTSSAAPGELRVRLATAADLPAALDIIRRVVPIMLADGNEQWQLDYPNAEVLGRDIAAGQLWIATEARSGGDAGNDAAVVGLAAISSAREPEYERLQKWAGGPAAPAIVVHRLATHPDWRGRGVAAKLMQQAESVAAGAGICNVRVDTNSANAATQKLFPKLGFSYVGEITLDFRPGLRFVCYEKVLVL
jgi:GNAT superfamily N-acetyltransferase